jgi:hypothetical protein
MLRVVPSEIVAFVDHSFAAATAQDEHPDKEFTLDWSHRGPLLALLRLLAELPDHLVTAIGVDYYWFLSAQEAIRGTVEEWSSGSHTKSLDKVPGTNHLNPVTVIRRTMRQCPDSFPAPGQVKFLFIGDPHLRANLEDDNGAIERAIANAEWKGATVLAGALIEAVLLWALDQRELTKPGAAAASAKQMQGQHAKDSLVDWVLDEYMKVAQDLQLLRPATVKEVTLAKDFRNLIHPGRAQRLQQPCDRATAFHAVAALDHVTDDLRTWTTAGMP